MKWLPAIALLLAPAASAQTFVAAKPGAALNATSVSSGAVTPSAGDYIAVHCNTDTLSAAPATVTDSQGNTYTAAGDYQSLGWDGEWFYAVAKAGTDTPKCTFKASSHFGNIFAVDVKGATGTDLKVNAIGTKSDPTASGTTAVANELVLSAVLCSATCSSTTGQNYTMDGYGNALSTLTVAAPGTASITYGPSNTQWMEQMLGFVGGTVVTNPPTVTMTAPAYSGTITLSATATDSNSTISSVQFLLDGSPLASPVTASPYQYAWATSGTTNGTHTIAATATNAAGQSTTSAGISVAISNTASSPMSIQSPITLPGATVNQGYSASLPALTELAGGVPPYTFSLASGTLPAGLTLSAAGVVAGTPTVVGTYPFTFTIVDSSGTAIRVELKVEARK
jgi:Big-like domain-containing protein/putative Ig domain-containing protein